MHIIDKHIFNRLIIKINKQKKKLYTKNRSLKKINMNTIKNLKIKNLLKVRK